MAKAKAFLDTRRVLKDGTYPLLIRITSGKIRKDIKLNIYLKKEEFDSTLQKVKKSHPNEKEINQRIRQSIIEVERTMLNLELKDELVTPEKVKNSIVKPTPKLNFIEYGNKVAQEMLAVKRIGNGTAYRDAITALQKYSGKTDLQFKELTYEFLRNVENKMLAKELKKNSIAAYNRAWRAIFNRAINEDIVEAKYYPYRKYKVKGEATAKRNITKEDIKAIATVELAEGSEIWHSRNYFILSFNLRGMSFADMLAIEPKDISAGRLVYKRKKTHKLYNVKLTDKAKELIAYYQKPGSQYVLPFLNQYPGADGYKLMKVTQQAIKTTNKYLDRIGKALKIERELTTYVARHSWATIAKKLGYSKDLIAEALGHEFGSKVTGIYLDTFDEEVIDDMNEKVCSL